MNTGLALPALLTASLLALALAGCSTPSGPAELTDQQICLDHFENDPVERDRCLLTPSNRTGTPPDMRPQDLPVRTRPPG